MTESGIYKRKIKELVEREKCGSNNKQRVSFKYNYQNEKLDFK
jgi:hypothetical protein